MNPKANAPKITLRHGRVRKRGEHLQARVKADGRWHVVARLAPAKADNPEAGAFVVQYLIVPHHLGDFELVKQVEESIRFYLIELAQPSPWAYLCHHTTTVSNLYDGESGGAYWTLIRATPPLPVGECALPPDPHFGTDEEMLAWCEREMITPVKDSEGNWDWMQAWADHEARSDGTED